MTLFNILYTNNNVSDKIKLKVNNAILKWENILNNKLPDGVSKITINVNLFDEGNNGTLGWATIDEFQYKNNINSFSNIFPLEGTFYINSYYSISEKTILHEIGHILGIGLFWIWYDSPVDKTNPNDRFYIGTNAVREYKKYCQNVGIDPDTIYGIPIEDDGHDGTANLHPEEGHDTHMASTNNRKKNDIFHPALNDELMSGISDGTNALSRITVGFLEDIGYNVNYNYADTYSLTLPPEYNPVIILLGNPNEVIEVKTTYIDPGATAFDTLYGDLTSSIVVVNTINTDIVGDYTITYNVTNKNGNMAESVIRNVSVVDVENNNFIHLKKGWNMIVQSSNLYISCSIKNIISPFYIYDNSYIKLEENNGFVRLNKSQCAWVRVADDTSILYKYKKSNLTKPVSENKFFIQLKKGWNMIGQSNYEQALFSTDNVQSQFYIYDKKYISLDENNGFVKLNKYQTAWIKVKDDTSIFYMKL